MKYLQKSINFPIFVSIRNYSLKIFKSLLSIKPKTYFSFISLIVILASLVFACKDPSLRPAFMGIVAAWLPIYQVLIGKD